MGRRKKRRIRSDQQGSHSNKKNRRFGGWDDLPKDILPIIFKKVRFDDLVVGVPAVCKQWHEASKDLSCWQHFDFQGDWYRIYRRLTSNYLGSAPFHRMLMFAIHQSKQSMVSIKFPELTAGSIDLLYLANSCPNIEHLSVVRTKPVSGKDFSMAVSKWTKLRSVEVDDEAVSKLLLQEINANCKDFVRLKVLGNVTMDAASAIVDYLPNLQHLDLSYCSLSSEALQLVQGRLRGLKSLDISNTTSVDVDSFTLIYVRYKICNFALWIRTFAHSAIETVIEQGESILEDVSEMKLRDPGVRRAVTRLRAIASQFYQETDPLGRNIRKLSMPTESKAILDTMVDIHAPYSDDKSGDQDSLEHSVSNGYHQRQVNEKGADENGGLHFHVELSS